MIQCKFLSSRSRESPFVLFIQKLKGSSRPSLYSSLRRLVACVSETRGFSEVLSLWYLSFPSDVSGTACAFRLCFRAAALPRLNGSERFRTVPNGSGVVSGQAATVVKFSC